MFATAAVLVVAKTAHRYPKRVSRAYADIGATLADFGFERVQGSRRVNDAEDMVRVFAAIKVAGAALAPRLGARHPRGAVVRLHAPVQERLTTPNSPAKS